MRDHLLDALLGTPKNVEVPLDSLMPWRVSNLLLVSSLYDCYTFIEDGRLSEMLFSEYLELNLRFTPSIQRVSTAQEALEKLHNEHFDLFISMPRVGDMNVMEFGHAAHAVDPNIRIVPLACTARDLDMLQSRGELPGIDKPFVWLGDVRLFIAIIKHVEDQMNAWHDVRTTGVKCILLVEDSVQYYSTFLPMLYTEIVKQTQSLMAEGVNRMQKMMRMRARPKILLATSYEQALELFERYRDNLLGVVLDAAFPRGGELAPSAGMDFARMARDVTPDLPILMQSGSDNPKAGALPPGVEFLDKNSPSLLGDLRDFMQKYLGFGDFVFRRPDGTVVTRAPDLRSLEWAMQVIPEDCLLFHASRNDFSTWLLARTEFDLANALRPRRVEEFEGAEDIRRLLLGALKAHRERARAGVVAEFSSGTFEGGKGFVRIGSGSLGGKGRGLAFVNSLLNDYRLEDRFPGVRIFVPPTAVLATGIFDQFMESAGLLPMALEEQDDDRITRAFLAAELPEEVVENLWAFLDWVRYPLAVRSSSLLEDASYQPFAGIYKTFMIPNRHEDPEVRLEELCNAVKMVYASTFHSDPKAYLEATPNRLEDEKMAVVIQQLVGREHDGYLYPDFAGVARSLNFYPMPTMRPEDGVASVALGFGKTVVEGGRCVRFSPAHPRKPMQSFTPQDYLENSQREFLAMDLRRNGPRGEATWEYSAGPIPLDIETAEKHGTLAGVGSVYSPDNDAVYDGLSRPGIRLVTMAGILKGSLCPLADILAFLLKVGAAGASCPVEIEFAASLADSAEKPHDFGFLQIRPLAFGTDVQDIQIEHVPPEDAICVAHKVLGNGVVPNVRDIVYVRRETFDRSQASLTAWEVSEANAVLKKEKRPYLLIGPGRWGSSDPRLGIPVKWAQISDVRCIVETGLKDIHVDPSQGSHFFQNIVSFGIGYLTVAPNNADDLLDYDWLDGQPAAGETAHVRHIALDEPLDIALNGRRNYGIVMKPGHAIGVTK
jgi:hypothetical protein